MKKDNKNIGFTIGKFAPFHIGHEKVINEGIKEMDEFIVIIYDTDVTKVPLKVRKRWIKDLYKGKVKVLYAKNPPKKYGLDEESVILQTNYLKQIVSKFKVTHFYCAEEYGASVSKHLDVVDRRIKKINEENGININATSIRLNPEKYKYILKEEVFNDIVKYEKN